MVDVRGDVLRPPHGTTSAAVKSNIKSEMRSFKSNENIHKKKEPALLLHIYIASKKERKKEKQTNKMACAPSEASDQPGHPPSLIRVFAARMKKAWVLTYPLSAQSKTLIRLGGCLG